MSSARPLGLFEGFGIELEYMIVESGSLAVLPVADTVLEKAAGELVDEVMMGDLAWSNELVLHVIELKTNGPAPKLAGLADSFAADVRRINALLEPLGGRLMPGAMHPWMDPIREMRLWPHDNGPIYQAYDRIFGCHGHGWANLQSMHINLPFSGDAEFARLHSAIRLVLPLLPALAASSPVMDGRPTGLLDNRLEVYRNNQRRIPSIAAQVIPEPVFSRAEYEERILRPMYRDIAAHDPQGVLQCEWLNSRGAIARFERSAIEIRVLDVQECPRADLAIASLVVAVVRALTDERWSSLAEQQRWPVTALERILLAAIRQGEDAVIEDEDYLELFGFSGGSCSAADLWRYLAEAVLKPEDEHRPALETIFEKGTLARRLLAALGATPGTERLRETYGRLCDCLENGEMFHG
ncbi:glutamate-cysteine ligase family protein [Desulfuromonas sp. TF]|uniref:carboxylate-amine ligase n=1 Tax=Desulfuromonas sp. TF TaxID=1232410 RepID=UPI0003FC09A4|nr:glutamate-cysteine ligase family protein [Desulfuromonas sp. TF]